MLDLLKQAVLSAAQRSVSDNLHKIDIMTGNLQPQTKRKLMEEKHKLQMLEQRALALDPELLLKRGYSITTHNGKTVRDISQLKQGDKIETRVEKGVIHSIVDNTLNTSN